VSRKIVCAALAVGLIVALSVTSADVPKTISFQGKLTSSKGALLNGTYDMIIRIYDAEPRMLFQESHPGVAVTAGVFNVLIGSRTVGGVPSAVFDTASTSVGVAVGTDAEMTPRLPLGAVPYAYRAEMAQAFEVPMSVTVASSSALLTLNNTSSGDAIIGIGAGGKGVYGMSTSDYGVYASSTNGPGAVYGQAGRSGAFAIKGAATSSSGSTVGVMGEALNSATGVGVVGNGGDRGVQGYGQAGHGVYGQTAATSGAMWGGYFIGNSHYGGGVYAESISGIGVRAKHTHASLTNPAVYGENSGSGDGVLGRATNALNAGIHGEHYGSGPGGQFSSATGPAILAEGEIKADKITYNTPRTHSYSLPGEAFQPGSDVGYTNTYGNGGAYINSGSGALVASVHLPDGAQVTALKAYFNDTSAADMSATLHRFYHGGGSYVTMASVGSSGTGGAMTDTDTTITNATIDNAAYGYLIYAFSDGWSSSLKLKSVVITYTVGEAE